MTAVTGIAAATDAPDKTWWARFSWRSLGCGAHGRLGRRDLVQLRERAAEAAGTRRRQAPFAELSRLVDEQELLALRRARGGDVAFVVGRVDEDHSAGAGH